MQQVSFSEVDAGYMLWGTNNVAAAGASPADGSTSYFPALVIGGFLPTQGTFRPPIARAGIIKSVSVGVVTGAAVGTSESVAYAIGVSGSFTVLDSAVSWAGASTYITKNYKGLSVALVQGDYAELRIVCPTWATNPTGVYLHWSAFVAVP